MEIGSKVFDKVTKLTGVVKASTASADSRKDSTAEVELENGDIVSGRAFRFDAVLDGVKRISQLNPFESNVKYSIDSSLGYLESNLEMFAEGPGIEYNPDFQRGHVWTEEQQSRFMEYRIRGGIYARDIWFNAVNWSSGDQGVVEVVDGLQRLTACRLFMANRIRAFGQLFSDFHPTDQRYIRVDSSLGLKFNVNDLPTRAKVLEWYLDLNAGGTPHSAEEISRVQALLAAELESK